MHLHEHVPRKVSVQTNLTLEITIIITVLNIFGMCNEYGKSKSARGQECEITSIAYLSSFPCDGSFPPTNAQTVGQL